MDCKTEIIGAVILRRINNRNGKHSSHWGLIASLIVFVIFAGTLGSLASPVFAGEYAEKIYENKAYGYSFDFNGLMMDNSNETVKTVFFSKDISIDIFYDNLEGTVHSVPGYVNYSNKNMRPGKYISNMRRTEDVFLGRPIIVHSWQRAPLKHGDDGLRYYASADIMRDGHRVYSVFIRSRFPFDPQEYLGRMNLTNFNPQASNDLRFRQYIWNQNLNWSKNVQNFYKEFTAIDKVQFGFFEPGLKHSNSLAELKRIEKAMGTNLRYVLEYHDLGILSPDGHIAKLYQDGRVLEFTFQTDILSNPISDPIYKMLDGEFDPQIKRMADLFKTVEGPILFRYNNEMNGDWCNYNALHYHRDTRMYTESWKYLYNKLHSHGVDNVIFVWNPNESSFPNFKWNHYTNYFPGVVYADVIGATGYNTGNYYPGERWRSFEKIYDSFMPEYKKRFLYYNFYITEFGSNIFGGDRNQWLEDMFDVIDKYGFKAAIYWNGTDWDGDKPARPYKIHDDEGALEVFRRRIQQRRQGQ